MCYFHTHSRVMITFIFKFFYFLSVIILSIYVLDSEISKFQIYVGKLSKKVPEPDPIIVKLYLSFVLHWKHFYGSAHVHVCIQVVCQEFSMLQKSRSSTQVCVGIPFTRRPYFYLLQHHLSRLSNGRYCSIHAGPYSFRPSGHISSTADARRSCPIFQ